MRDDEVKLMTSLEDLELKLDFTGVTEEYVQKVWDCLTQNVRTILRHCKALKSITVMLHEGLTTTRFFVDFLSKLNLVAQTRG
jgi:hypothetical protein